MEKTFTDFHTAWKYLDDCEYYKYIYTTEKGEEVEMGSFQQALYIMVVKVNPKTNSIDDDNSKNTKTQVWLESGSYIYDENVGGWIASHDIDLDTGGNTFEEAITNLANLVSKLKDK